MADQLVGGTVHPRFATVNDVFLDVLRSQPGTGAALAVWYDDQWVVDLWGGWADGAHTRPWSEDTLVMPYSVTKPFAAVCALLLADRGRIDLDAPLTTYWPELTAATTMRQVLSHQSGLVVLDHDAPEEAFYDWDLMCRLLAAQQPTWQPGTAHGESALFFGHLVGEVVRRVDGRSLGQFLHDEVCRPHDIDFHVGLRSGELGHVADLTGYDEEFRRAGVEGRDSLLVRALNNPPGALDPAVVNGEAWRRAEVPAVNGHGTARGVAGLYVALQQGRVLSADMLRQATTVHASGPDRVIGSDCAWGLGFGVDPDGYGMGGVGGSFGWWSEAGRYAVGFVTGHIGDYDRGERLEDAVRTVLGLPPV
ncbi:MAG: serine hydrolase domain-containing protein [Nocardioidaceae bacterium]